VNSFSQDQISDLVKDLTLSKEAAEILSCCLSEHRMLDSKAMWHFTVVEMKCFIVTLVKKVTSCFTTALCSCKDASHWKSDE